MIIPLAQLANLNTHRLLTCEKQTARPLNITCKAVIKLAAQLGSYSQFFYGGYIFPSNKLCACLAYQIGNRNDIGISS